ncbi:class E sortase [Streptomyces sp. NPDC051909]|uniref:class E sortase n=1 Tax=Streptomyces sp. NPDC051909 TaxID=3154944 RepID=UPI00343938A0
MPRSAHPRKLVAVLAAGVAVVVAALLALLTGGSPAHTEAASDKRQAPPSPRPSAPPSPTRASAPTTTPAPAPTPASHPRVAELDIPSIGVAGLRVVPYEGTTDDRAGTRIQDRGMAASPYGKRGGTGPGDIGNYLVTAHRLSAGGPLGELPSVEKGDRVLVTAGGQVYEYRITETRSTSFRSARSLAEQRAAVPGSPGEHPTEAMITLSTCATPEDNAAGNFWRDAQGNPEHRIDKVGVLVSVRPAADGPS